MIAPPRPKPIIQPALCGGYWVICRSCRKWIPIGSKARAEKHSGECLPCELNPTKLKT